MYFVCSRPKGAAPDVQVSFSSTYPMTKEQAEQIAEARARQNVGTDYFLLEAVQKHAAHVTVNVTKP